MSEHNNSKEESSNNDNNNGQKNRARSSIDYNTLSGQKKNVNVIEYIEGDEGVASAGASPKAT